MLAFAALPSAPTLPALHQAAAARLAHASEVGHRPASGTTAYVACSCAAAVAAAVGRRHRRQRGVGRKASEEGVGATVVEVDPIGDPGSIVNRDLEIMQSWCMVPPERVRDRISQTRGMLGRGILSYIGDAVWEYLVLKHQYVQAVRSPFCESQIVRTVRQSKVAVTLYWDKRTLTDTEKEVLRMGMSNSWRQNIAANKEHIKRCGLEQVCGAHGLRTLLGYLYLDAGSDDERLKAVAQQIGLDVDFGVEDQLLAKITGGVFDESRRPGGGNRPRTFFLALAPLGNLALRLYVSRYFAARPARDDEYIYRVKLALRQEEIDLAAVGFMRDEATAEELALMRGARDTQDSYGFAFECLLGYLALTKPYRLHQIVAEFGWAMPLPDDIAQF